MNQTKAESDPALQWAVDYLTKNHGGSIANYHRIVETAWSTVYQISISDNTFYLKKTPPQLFTEVRTITWLRNQGTTSIPVLVVENESLCCFLMLSCGDVALREHFSGKVRADLLVQGVMHYTNIQRTLECNIPEMQSLNLPDWQLKQIPPAVSGFDCTGRSVTGRWPFHRRNHRASHRFGYLPHLVYILIGLSDS